MIKLIRRYAAIDRQPGNKGQVEKVGSYSVKDEKRHPGRIQDD